MKITLSYVMSFVVGTEGVSGYEKRSMSFMREITDDACPRIGEKVTVPETGLYYCDWKILPDTEGIHYSRVNDVWHVPGVPVPERPNVTHHKPFVHVEVVNTYIHAGTMHEHASMMFRALTDCQAVSILVLA